MLPLSTGYDKDAAEKELSQLQEAAERAAIALDFATALPKDQFAASMVNVSLQEVRSRSVVVICGQDPQASKVLKM